MKKHFIFALTVIFAASLSSLALASPKGSMSGEESGSMKGSDHSSMKGSDAGSMGVMEGKAVAVIQSTGEEAPDVNGTVEFSDTADGLKVVARLKGVTPAGKHGFHIHESGSCADGGKAAGGHFNPWGTEHGFLPSDGMQKAHAGDMGNITISENGEGSLEVVLPGLKVSGYHGGVAGRAVILHAQEDDFGQPTGNAGGRIGCGTITILP